MINVAIDWIGCLSKWNILQASNVLFEEWGSLPEKLMDCYCTCQGLSTNISNSKKKVH